MVIDQDTFTDLTLHVRRASDGLLVAARQMAVVCDPQRADRDDRADLDVALSSLVVMNQEFVVIEELLRSIWESNRKEESSAC